MVDGCIRELNSSRVQALPPYTEPVRRLENYYHLLEGNYKFGFSQTVRQSQSDVFWPPISPCQRSRAEVEII
jgi:hypothetical protein